MLPLCRQKQALDKLRGKNGDVKITAKDGFCMQKLLGGYDQDINWCPDWLRQIWSKDHCDYTWQWMNLQQTTHPGAWKRILRIFHKTPSNSLQSYTHVQLTCYGCFSAKKFWMLDFLTNSFAFSLLKMDSLLQSFSLSLSRSLPLSVIYLFHLFHYFSTFYTATSCNDVIFIIKRVCWIFSSILWKCWPTTDKI